MYKYFVLVWVLMSCVFTTMAQKPDTTTSNIIKSKASDTLISTRRDTDISKSFKPKPHREKVYHPDTLHSPQKAAIHSLIIPGWGQAYNRQWWKVPIIYGGIGLLGWAIVFNNNYYKEFLALSKYREHGIIPVKGDPYFDDYVLYTAQPDEALYNATDAYRRNRDLSILGVVAAWGINVVDAYIDAKFMHSYSVDNNLSMKITPELLNQPVYAQNVSNSYMPAIKITFTLR